MQELHFTLDCRGCGVTFARSIEPPRSARDPITLYCRHCGCPNEVAPGDGVLRDHWSAVNLPPAAADTTVAAVPASATEPSRADGEAMHAAPHLPPVHP